MNDTRRTTNYPFAIHCVIGLHAATKFLKREMSNDPVLWCNVIDTCFKVLELTSQRLSAQKNALTSGYWIISSEAGRDAELSAGLNRGRGRRIRPADRSAPSRVLYQTELYPVA